MISAGMMYNNHKMKRLFKLCGAVIVAAIGLTAQVTSVWAATDTNSFVISDYQVEMTLGKDDKGRSVLKATETITAEFPESDQSHGLERVFVTRYDNHPAKLDVTSVTDASGSKLPYHWSGDALRIGDSTTYAHGSKTYVINYTQRDVTRYYADTDRDEWYWDVIGVDWRVPIAMAHVRLSISPEIANAIAGSPQCYQGVSGSTTTCDLQTAPTLAARGSNEPLMYMVSLENTGSGQGLTVAFGFAKGTFAKYEASLWQQVLAIWGVAQAVSAAVAAALIGWLIVRSSALTSRRKEIGTIVPEYLPPKDASVTTSATIGGYRNAVMTAQLLDLAVRHYIKIYQVREKTLFRSAEYEIEIIKPIDDLKWEEKELLRDTFGELPTTVTQRINLKTLKNNQAYFKRTLNNDGDLDKLIKGDYGLKHEDVTLKQWLRRVAKIVLVLSILTLSVGLVVAALVAFIMSIVATRLTDEGLALTRYLRGLKMYIDVAEAERLKMLQSPEGAEKIASVAKGTDSAQLIALYERVLPYAVLFGQEKEWNKQLGSYYESNGTHPDWYVGQSSTFNAAAFSSGMNGLASASSSVSSASSSSGGSTGGGSSGGGGGGGGGGGW